MDLCGGAVYLRERLGENTQFDGWVPPAYRSE